jgi:S-adenosylmethionine decarboxylase proenzyme
MNGLHLIGDFRECRCDLNLLLDSTTFQNECLKFVGESKLTTVTHSFHQFLNSGFTGAIILAESHLAIHTWPEMLGFTLDVYVCNYSTDNTIKARDLFGKVINYFNPEIISTQEVIRK